MYVYTYSTPTTIPEAQGNPNHYHYSLTAQRPLPLGGQNSSRPPCRKAVTTVSSHNFNPRDFESRVANPIPEHIELCDALNHSKSIACLRTCMPSRTQSPRVWKKN